MNKCQFCGLPMLEPCETAPPDTCENALRWPRASGRTSQQMLDAPRGAWFVWPVTHSIGYAFHLSRHLGRTDLRILSLYVSKQTLRINPRYPVVYDHACERTP